MALRGTYVLPHPPLAVHEVGRGEEKKIADTLKGYESVAEDIAAKRPDTIVLFTPHSDAYADYFHISSGKEGHGSFAQFGAPQVVFRQTYDETLIASIEKTLRRQNIRGGTKGGQSSSLDHGTMVPLYFVNKHYKDYELVRISISGLPLSKHYRFGQALQEAFEASRKDIVVVASGDLSHRLKKEGPYGYVEEGPRFDKKCVEALKNANFEALLRMDSRVVNRAGEGGLRPFVMMAGVLDKKSVKPIFHSYEGPFGVGYATLSFEVGKKDDNRNFQETFNKEAKKKAQKRREHESEPVKFARKIVENLVLARGDSEVSKEDKQRLNFAHHGAFVTLKMHGVLRGCIGTSFPSKPTLAEEIAANAKSAALHDPRFPPVEASELPFLEYSVDVLKAPEVVENKDSLDPSRYGVLVENNGKTGLLLPDIEGVNTPEEQIQIALQKAGISMNESYTIKRFEVERFF